MMKKKSIITSLFAFGAIIFFNVSLILDNNSYDTDLSFLIGSAIAQDNEDNPAAREDHITDPDPCTFKCKKIGFWGQEITEEIPGELIECHYSKGAGTCTPSNCRPLGECWSS